MLTLYPLSRTYAQIVAYLCCVFESIEVGGAEESPISSFKASSEKKSERTDADRGKGYSLRITELDEALQLPLSREDFRRGFSNEQVSSQERFLV